MKNKRTVGIIALVFLGISFIAWMLLIFTGGMFSSRGGFSALVPIVFISFFLSGITAFVCLAGDVIKFAGKMFSSGFNSTNNSPNNSTPNSSNVKFCPKCGKQLESTATFCSACGQQQN